MRTGAPVLNEKQELTDFYGRRTILVSSTFPLEYSGELIGTMETSVFYHKDAQLDGKNDWLANPHKGLFRLDDIITQNPEMLDVSRIPFSGWRPTPLPCSFGERPARGRNSLPSHSIATAPGPGGRLWRKTARPSQPPCWESTLFGTTRGSYTGAENRERTAETG